MAIYTPGPIIGAVSGTVGGLNFTTGPGSPVVRRALRRADKQTERQLDARRRLAAVHKAWRDLDTPMRLAWCTAAEKITRRNRLGTPRHPSGHQLYVEMNLAKITDFVPSILYPPIPTRTSPPYNVVLTINLPDQYLVAWSEANDPNNRLVRVFVSRPLTTRPYFKSFRWRWILSAAPPTNALDIKDEIIEQWGAPRAGELVALRIQSAYLDHQPSIWSPTTTIVLP